MTRGIFAAAARESAEKGTPAAPPKREGGEG
jgi:hypothetical protein